MLLVKIIASITMLRNGVLQLKKDELRLVLFLFLYSCSAFISKALIISKAVSTLTASLVR